MKNTLKVQSASLQHWVSQMMITWNTLLRWNFYTGESKVVIIIKVVPFFSLNKGTALETTGSGKFSSLKTRKSLKLAVLYLFIYFGGDG